MHVYAIVPVIESPCKTLHVVPYFLSNCSSPELLQLGPELFAACFIAWCYQNECRYGLKKNGNRAENRRTISKYKFYKVWINHKLHYIKEITIFIKETCDAIWNNF